MIQGAWGIWCWIGGGEREPKIMAGGDGERLWPGEGLREKSRPGETWKVPG